ncbi:MAG: hypothetical protein RR626_05775 [Anaerovoracaceae bacterium]
MNKVLELYDLMAQGYEGLKFGTNQARVYGEILEFIKDCKSPEEVAEKLRGSKYYLAPGTALIKDQITALQKAAEENGNLKLAQVYEEKLNRIAEDEQNAYVADYDAKVKSAETEYYNRRSGFVAAYNGYLEFLIAAEKEKAEKAEEFSKLRKAFCAIAGDMEALETTPHLKDLIFATEEGYKAFCETMRSGTLPHEAQLDLRMDNVQDAATVWKQVKKNKKTITDIGKEAIEKTKRVACIAVPPKEEEGEYVFSNRMEEGY